MSILSVLQGDVNLTIGSVCSGIGGGELAFEGLAESVFMSEIELFPRAVLECRFPDVKLIGDFTQLIENPIPCDILVGGPPCQAFSVAGKRLSLEDARGNLTLTYAMLLDSIDEVNKLLGKEPCICLYENVPGLLSVKDEAFGCLLGALVGFNAPIVNPGKQRRWPNCGLVIGPKRHAAWRVLDAQYFGLAQRRKRVFIVASARKGFDPAAVLLESKSLSGNTAKSRKTQKDITRTAEQSTSGNGEQEPVSLKGYSQYTNHLPTLRASGGDHGGGSEALVPVVYSLQERSVSDNIEISFTLEAKRTPQIAAYGGGNTSGPIDIATTINAQDQLGYTVRRLTPIECERLQGFQDNWTLIPNCSKTKQIEEDYATYLRQYFPDMTDEEIKRLSKDGPRYKALGNAFAVPVVRWIAGRLVAEIKRVSK